MNLSTLLMGIVIEKWGPTVNMWLTPYFSAQRKELEAVQSLEIVREQSRALESCAGLPLGHACRMWTLKVQLSHGGNLARALESNMSPNYGQACTMHSLKCNWAMEGVQLS